MGLSGCCCLVKYLLILINFVFWAAGIAAFTLFGWMLTDTSLLVSLTQGKSDVYIGLLVFVGVATLVIIIAFLGCCGALKESQCMLVSFFCFLLVVLVAEIATGVYAYLNQDQLLKIVRTSVKHSIQEDYSVNNIQTQAFDAFQKHLECCGAEGPKDWQTSKFNNNTKALNLDVSSPPETFIIPQSCCKANISEAICKKETRIPIGASKIESQSIHLKGCSEKLVQEAQNHLLIILAIIAGILVFEIFALMISLCLCCAVGDREDDYKS
ncbi:CD9 antigen-like [Sitodiplosis mosellana]|uniref:CD9 antigen-like n=1 Tax=Sitodiplosis mosellana TaxID=263140 RepID=UPI002444573A|nr:CD9 antigen-like [Sitodiplosis mosellana]XP_055296707.1 CD9 antigen-like [Sitodiplosis mosellana]XP_055296709.1 CD9 antigen-like [Sitodiplosis mosellana]XP_055296710.1 CD9 antigen-like [Sitodiplosis mosellana]XP_055296711.1 CD9 antigen-like [Sitodiplosis mosellana]XP_055296712.1 CD9 antigen-like [Sitodiplosis mosellana]